MSRKKTERLYDFSPISIARGVLLFFLPLTAYIIAALPIVTGVLLLWDWIPYSGALYYISISVLLIFGFLLLLILETFVPGLFIRIFRIRVNEGEYKLTIKDKGFFLHLLYFILYRPSLRFIGIIPLVPLRLMFLKLVGLRIGIGSHISGTELIDEPYAVIIGKNTLVGGYSIIFSHLSHKTMIMRPVIIGDNCFIGNKSIIMPGVIIEDDVIVEPGCVVPMNRVLTKGKRYAGNPAKEVQDS